MKHSGLLQVAAQAERNAPSSVRPKYSQPTSRITPFARCSAEDRLAGLEELIELRLLSLDQLLVGQAAIPLLLDDLRLIVAQVSRCLAIDRPSIGSANSRKSRSKIFHRSPPSAAVRVDLAVAAARSDDRALGVADARSVRRVPLAVEHDVPGVPQLGAEDVHDGVRRRYGNRWRRGPENKFSAKKWI
jgi:hypothetical protein